MIKKEELRKRRMARNKKSFIFVTILCMGIGFAFLSTNLSISGVTNVLGSKWSIYFDNISVSEGSTDSELPLIDSDKTTVNFGVTLANPGDFYEFTVDVVNDGTVDAMVDSIAMSSLSSDVAKYLSYTATYSDGSALSKKDILEAKKTATYKIRIEFLRDVIASDLNENGISLNLVFGVNYIQSTINVEKPKPLLTLFQKQSQSDGNINFKDISSTRNGNGLFLLSGTEEDQNPIYYYRGDVDNNIYYAGYCWNIVRTTETGGTKLVYNGIPTKKYENYQQLDSSYYVIVEDEYSQNYPSFEFDETVKKWKSTNKLDSEISQIMFKVKEAGDYILKYKVSSEKDSDFAYFYNSEWGDLGRFSGEEEGIINLTGLTTSSTISVAYVKNDSNSSGNDEVIFSLEKGLGESSVDCSNNRETEIGFGDFSEAYSINGSSYMYGSIFRHKIINVKNDVPSGTLYGESVTYSNGTYTLVNTITDNNDLSHNHYTCLNSTGQCENVYYIFYQNGIQFYYSIILKDGKTIDIAIEEMQRNENDSNVKKDLENWFSDNIVEYYSVKQKDYKDYLEDTIWCNDRKIVQYGGWKPDGSTSEYLYFGASERFQNGTPSLACPNKNDAFTVAESATGNGALTYPVGLLTVDELVLAGSGSVKNQDYYLYTDDYLWSMSPEGFDYYSSNTYALGDGKISGAGGVTYESRPTVSLKAPVKVFGSGTKENPYIVVED